MIGTSISFGNISPSLKLPDGRSVMRVPAGELYTALDRLGIAGFSHRHGLERNLELYADHLASIAAEAGKVAVAQWLAEHRNV